MNEPERVLALWVPDWPVHAYLAEAAEEGDASVVPNTPIALIANHRVTACSAQARHAGVRAGVRERDARMCCPELSVFPHDPEVDARRFGPVLVALEHLIPGVELLRPGLCAMRARGPSRYYGSEEDAAEALLARVVELGFPDARVGVASGRFTAEQATRAHPEDPGVVVPAHGIRVVPPADTALFLATLPVSRAAAPDLATVLSNLGIRTLGGLAALPEEAIRERFGAAGVAAHRRARGLGAAHAAEITPQAPHRDLAIAFALEPPLDAADQLAFASSAHVDTFARGLLEHGLVCTELRVELTDDIGVRHERVWAHPKHFTPADVLNRVRWQAGAVPSAPERGGSGIAEVRLTPVCTADAARHEPGLWNSAPNERVHHHLSRVQSLVGHDGVGTSELSGGRRLIDRQHLVPWGTRPDTRGASRAHSRMRSGPWPGHLDGALPNTIFTRIVRAELLSRDGVRIYPDADDLLSADPHHLRIEGSPRAEIHAWSSPWPIYERWWAGGSAGYRLQVVLVDGDAWLLRYTTEEETENETEQEPGRATQEKERAETKKPKPIPTGGWFIEAHYA